MQKDNLNTKNFLKTNDYTLYKPNLTFAIPHSGTIPTNFVSTDLDIEKVAGHLANLNTEVLHVIDYLTSEATWANETAFVIEKLRIVILPLISALIPIKLNPLMNVPNQTERFDKYNSYFRIAEYRNMDLLQLLKEDVNLLQAILIEMQIIKMDEQEIINFLRGVAIRFGTYQQILGVEVKGSNSKAKNFNSSTYIDPLLYDCRISSAFYRWFTCHWDFAINVIHARYHYDAAGKYFANGDKKGAAEAIVKAAILIRATTADMVFGCSMPAKTYQEFIRPSMGQGFSGNDNPQWAVFAASKKSLLAMPGIKNDEAIISAWAFFLEKYLQDIEVHTTIADKLVGERPSLIIDELNQGIPDEEKDRTSATAGLRNLHYMRLAEFSFLNSYPILFTLFKLK